MRYALILSLLGASLSACEDATPTPGAMDVPRFVNDRAPIPTDGALPDLPPEDVVTDRPVTGRAGGFRPCECDAGVQGSEYCVNGAYEGLCRCGDAGPPDLDAARDSGPEAGSDGGAVDAGDATADAAGG